MNQLFLDRENIDRKVQQKTLENQCDSHKLTNGFFHD